MSDGGIVGGSGAAGSKDPGYCTWTKTGGVWSVTSSCTDGNICIAMSSTSHKEDATDGTKVSFTDMGTIIGNYGMTDAAFDAFLAHRGIPISSIVTNRVGEATLAKASDANDGDSFVIPCVPATTPTPSVPAGPPKFGPF